MKLIFTKFFEKETNQTFSSIAGNTILADENYMKWEANGGKELQLSAFRLTNRQMLWLTSAHRYTSKYHINVPKSYDEAARLQIKYLHVRYKGLKGFRDAFGCGNMTQAESDLLKEFKTLDKIVKGVDVEKF